MSGDRVVDDVKRIFDDLGDVAERLQAGRFAQSLQPLVTGEAEDPVLEATRRARERAVGKGIDGLNKLAKGRAHDLNDDERFGLEAIVLLEGRPAILIQEGDFLQPPHEWSRLTEHREGIREVIARSGRKCRDQRPSESRLARDRLSWSRRRR